MTHLMKIEEGIEGKCSGCLPLSLCMILRRLREGVPATAPAFVLLFVWWRCHLLPVFVEIMRNLLLNHGIQSRSPCSVQWLCHIPGCPSCLGWLTGTPSGTRATRLITGTRTPLHHGATLAFSATRPYPTTCQQLFPPRSRPPLLPLIFLLSPPWAPRSLQHGRPISFPPTSPAVDASRGVR